MTQLSSILPNIKLITFDCYGTLIDWESGIREALASLLQTIDVTWNEAIFNQYLELEARHESQTYRSYKETLSATEVELLQKLGVNRHDEPQLASSVGRWRAFPDTVESLQCLKTRFQLGVLSNIDRDLFEHTSGHLQTHFDILVTAEDVHSYKPSPAHFLKMLEMTPLDISQILHVAQSLFHDHIPCAELGMMSVWINRRCESNRTAARPIAEFADLKSFVQAVMLS